MKRSTKAILAATGLTVAALTISTRAGLPPQDIIKHAYNYSYDAIWRDGAAKTLFIRSANCQQPEFEGRLLDVFSNVTTTAMQELNKRGIAICFLPLLGEKEKRSDTVVQAIYYPRTKNTIETIAIWDSRRFDPASVINSLPQNFNSHHFKEGVPLQAKKEPTGRRFQINWTPVQAPQIDLYASPFKKPTI